MKILEIDIEVSPNIAFAWGTNKQHIHYNYLLEDSRTLCWAAKWFGDKDIIFDSEWSHKGKNAHRKMIEHVHKLLDEADAVIHYNGKSFDIPTLNKEFLCYRLPPPSPYKQIDLYQVMSSTFRTPSRKLDYITKMLGLGEKVKHHGMELWKEVAFERKPEAQAVMETYNIQDVALLEELYLEVRPWIKSHPNYALYTDTDRPVCTNCGSGKLQSRGYAKTQTQIYRRFVCTGCGTWQRERTTVVPKERKSTILTKET